MRFDSLERFDLSAARLVFLALAASAGAAAATAALTGEALGSGAEVADLVVGSLVFYVVASAPGRILARERVALARESLHVLTAAKAYLSVTGSRPRTLIELRARDPTFARALREAARMTLLGVRVEDSVAKASEGLPSYSAAAALRSAGTLDPAAIGVDDDESRGLSESDSLGRETKLPVFTTACFFSPILILLYAVFSCSYSPVGLAELGALEFVGLDLAFYLCSGGGGPP